VMPVADVVVAATLLVLAVGLCWYMARVRVLAGKTFAAAIFLAFLSGCNWQSHDEKEARRMLKDDFPMHVPDMFVEAERAEIIKVGSVIQLRYRVQMTKENARSLVAQFPPDVEYAERKLPSTRLPSNYGKDAWFSTIAFDECDFRYMVPSTSPAADILKVFGKRTVDGSVILVMETRWRLDR